jgi:hypothetical protein
MLLGGSFCASGRTNLMCRGGANGVQRSTAIGGGACCSATNKIRVFTGRNEKGADGKSATEMEAVLLQCI